jgi:3-oxoacyl-[acyl-carrier protein] reductase
MFAPIDSDEYEHAWERSLTVLLTAHTRTIRAALAHLRRAEHPRIVNIASELAYLGRAEFSAYCASKAAILGLTRSWAREFAPDILVNTVAPGPVDTPMLDIEVMSQACLDKETDIPLGRVGRPEEIASVIAFLAGPEATFVTGQTFSPNGGAVML